mgnify:CR=1 FL=1
MTRNLSNKSTYEGEFKENKRDGFGSMFYISGAKFSGNWKNDSEIEFQDHEGQSFKVCFDYPFSRDWQRSFKVDFNWEEQKLNDELDGGDVFVRGNIMTEKLDKYLQTFIKE